MLTSLSIAVDELKDMKTKLSQFELNYKNRRRNLKSNLRLHEEQDVLDKLELGEIDVDDVDDDQLNDIVEGRGGRVTTIKTVGDKSTKGNLSVYGASVSDQKFMKNY